MKRKWIIWSAFFGGMLILASFRGGRLPYMLLYFVVAIVVSSFVYTLAVMFRFKYFQAISAVTAVKEEPVDYRFVIRNEDKFFYERIQVEFFEDYSRVSGVDQTCLECLGPGEGREFTAKLVCKYRGEYEVGLCRFCISDYLHFFSIPYRVKSPMKMTVLPRIAPWKYEAEILKDAGGRNQGSGTDAPDISVREFSAGDGMRRIHWKASAKMGKLMSREMYEDRRQGMLLFLDLKRMEGEERERLKYEDELIEQAVAAVYACKNRQIPVTVVCEWEGRKVCRVVSDEDWNEFYKMSGRLCFSAEHSIAYVNGDRRLPGDAKYALILTGALNGELYDWIMRDFSGIRTSIIEVAKRGSAGGEERFAASGIAVYRAYTE